MFKFNLSFWLLSTLMLSTSTAQTNDTCLDPAVIQITPNGLSGNGSEAGLTAALTSDNNFINFCKDKTLTKGTQISTGSCNPIVMGDIASVSNMPAAKFQTPMNLEVINEGTNFTVKVAIQNMETGIFTNAFQTYYAAPCEINPATGNLFGHSHIVIQPISSLNSTAVVSSQTFAFFQGLNTRAVDGTLNTTVSGLPAGFYKMSTINTCSTHQPVLVSFAQHASLDDTIYFTVKAMDKGQKREVVESSLKTEEVEMKRSSGDEEMSVKSKSRKHYLSRLSKRKLLLDRDYS